MFFTFPISYIYNKSFRLRFHAIPYFILQLLPHYKHRDCCFKILSVLHDTNTLPISYLSISITRYCFLPSLSHRFTLSQSGLTCKLYHISYYMEAAPLWIKGLLLQNIVLFGRHQYGFYYLLLNTKFSCQKLWVYCIFQCALGKHYKNFNFLSFISFNEIYECIWKSKVFIEILHF